MRPFHRRGLIGALAAGAMAAGASATSAKAGALEVNALNSLLPPVLSDAQKTETRWHQRVYLESGEFPNPRSPRAA